MCEESILYPIPHTQHRPICVTVKPVIVPQPTTFRRRFNLRKADWLGYSTQVDQSIDEVDAAPECNEQFVGIIRMTPRKHIPRGCRTNYIPSLTDESKTSYEAYQEQYRCNPLGDGTIDAGNKLIELMAEHNKERWQKMITSIDLTHNSRNAWKTIQIISNDPTTPTSPCLVNANQVAHQLLVNGRGNMRTKPVPPILTTVEQSEQSLVYPFTEGEYRKGITTLKNNKAAGIDHVLVEQLKHLEPRAHRWLHSMLNTCFTKNKIPKV